MKINKKLEILFIFFVSLTPLLWFSNPESLILGHDSGFRIKYAQYLIDLFYSWNPNIGFGQDLTINKGFLITQLPETFFSLITGSLRTGEMLTFVFWFLAMGISMYAFINSFFPEKRFWVFRVFTSVFYMFNFFVLQGWFIAERAKFSLFAALPLGLLVLYKTLTREYSLPRGAILFSLIFFFLNGGSSPPLYGSLLLVYALTVIYFSVLVIRQKKYREVFFYLKTIVLFGLCTALLNAYWILPQMYLITSAYAVSLTSQGGIEGILGWESVVSKYASLINVLRLQGIPDWYENSNHAYANSFLSNNILVLASFLPLLLILFGYYSYNAMHKKDKNDRLFFLIGLILIVGVIFTAGSHPPFGFLYVLLIKYLPGFAIFRSAFYKFGPATWFAVIFLTGYFFNLFILRHIRNARVAAGVGVAGIAFILLYHFPYFQGNFFIWSKPFTTRVTLPQYVREISDHVNTQTPESSRVLLMPALDSGSPNADSYEWGYWSLDLLPILSINRSVIANTSNAPLLVNQLYNAITSDDVDLFRYGSGLVGADKILWRGDVLYNNKITTSDRLRSEYEPFLTSYKDKKMRGAGKWTLYENESLPLFFAPETLTFSRSPVPILYAFDSLRRPAFPLHVNLEGASKDVRDTVEKNATAEVVSALCVFCDDNLLWNLQRNTYIPPARIAPGSLFYPFKAEKERESFSRVRKTPEPRIDMNLSMATTRLTELWSLAGKTNSAEQQESMRGVMGRYREHMNDAVKQLRLLPAEKQNDYKIRLLQFFQMHNNYLGTIENSENIPQTEFVQLLRYIRSTSGMVQRDAWITTTNDRKRYLIDVVQEDVYTVYVKNSRVLPAEIVIDDKPLTGDTVRLSAGQHRLELRQKASENLFVPDNESLRGEYRLSFGDAKTFSMRNFRRQEEYIIEFDYRALQGKNPYFAIDQFDNKGKEIQMEHPPIFQLDAINERFYYTFIPHPASENVRFRFFTDAKIDELSDFTVQNISVTTKNNPYVILTRGIKQGVISVPEVAYTRLDPAKYQIEIRDAQSPYFLLFNQNFSNGWKLRSDQAIPESMHFIANSYANGWYIDKTGDYMLTLEYAPQRYVYVGMAVSSIALVLYLGILIVIRKR